MSDAANVVPDGGKGLERQRAKGDPIKPYLQARRPNADDDRWVSYRTEACVGFNNAQRDGAGADVLARLRAEYDAAVAAIGRISPHVLDELACDDADLPAVKRGQMVLFGEVGT